MSRIGARLGQYTLHERINSGGMSEIWLASNEAGQSCAVRLMLNDSMFAFAERKRFLAGCETLRSVSDHPLIIGYIEHGKIGGEMALVMEYVEGANLKLLMGEPDSALSENVSQVLLDMAVALEHLHDRGFMHLDFKPENVLLTRNGSLRLIDFDLARPIPREPERSEKNPGTPAYMAPEQLLREPMDHRVDIWAWGVSAYELLTFRKPFPGDSPDEVLRRQLDRKEFIPPHILNEGVPIALSRIIVKCLEKEMGRRHPIMSVLVHELRTALIVEEE